MLFEYSISLKLPVVVEVDAVVIEVAEYRVAGWRVSWHYLLYVS